MKCLSSITQKISHSNFVENFLSFLSFLSPRVSILMSKGICKSASARTTSSVVPHNSWYWFVGSDPCVITVSEACMQDDQLLGLQMDLILYRFCSVFRSFFLYFLVWQLWIRTPPCEVQQKAKEQGLRELVVIEEKRLALDLIVGAFLCPCGASTPLLRQGQQTLVLGSTELVLSPYQWAALGFLIGGPGGPKFKSAYGWACMSPSFWHTDVLLYFGLVICYFN